MNMLFFWMLYDDVYIACNSGDRFVACSADSCVMFYAKLDHEEAAKLRGKLLFF